jgi:uncharacterized RDD family membrane protein YckC
VSAPAPQHYRGQRIGLPVGGAGSLASTGTRLTALLVDCVASALIASLFVQRGDRHGVAARLPGSWSLIPLAVDYLVGLVLGGQTLGMHLFGIRVARVEAHSATSPASPASPASPITPVTALVRTVLLFALIPALVVDRDSRGLHDRVTGTAVVRA